MHWTIFKNSSDEPDKYTILFEDAQSDDPVELVNQMLDDPGIPGIYPSEHDTLIFVEASQLIYFEVERESRLVAIERRGNARMEN